MRTFILIVSAVLYGTLSQGQALLEDYIKEGLANNQAISQRQLSLEKSLYALKEAKTLFFPTVDFEANYFLAGGGRTVDFPAGDILNPVYSTLNQITESSNFPLVENQRILLNPNNFYDVRFRTSMPLLNAEIGYNQRIKSKEASLQQIELNIYKRELVKEIKTAYFGYVKASEAIKIYEEALVLANENHRINLSLFENGKANRTVVLRSRNELVKYQAQLEVAQESAKNAQAYFNFLLNKELDEAIQFEPTYLQASIFDISSEWVAQREEVLQLQTAIEINDQLVGLANSYKMPKLSAFLDLGYQGFNWETDNQNSYFFFGFAMQWNVFSAGRNKHKVKQAELSYNIAKSQSDQVSQQLDLQLISSLNNLNAAQSQYQAALGQLESTKQYLLDIQKRYKEGKALFIELLDAQNQHVVAQLETNIFLFEAHIKAAEVERAKASFGLPY